MKTLDDKFQDACSTLINLSQRTSDAELLEYYALFKQATLGDLSDNIIVWRKTPASRIKFDAWYNKKGLDSTAAKVRYVVKVQNLEDKYKREMSAITEY